MHIKSFSELSILQKKELYSFINLLTPGTLKSSGELEKRYASDEFNDGKNVLVLVDNERILGCLGVITKDIEFRSEAFIVDININFADTSLSILINSAIALSISHGAKAIKLGIRKPKEYLIPYIENAGFNMCYSAVIMKLSKDKIKSNDIGAGYQMQELSKANSQIYCSINNNAFQNSPNGGSIDEYEAFDLMINHVEVPDMIGVFTHNGTPCGVYELSSEGFTGWIHTLAIDSSFQGNGLGKLLLNQSISKLYSRGAEEIKLLVISSNEKAVSLYKSYGFEDESIFSIWFEKASTNTLQYR